MSAILVDSNILLDIATENPIWSQWSADHLARCADGSELVINPLIYAEVSIAYAGIEALDKALPVTLFRREALPWEAAFLAGKNFLKSRQQQGGRGNSPSLELYVGAHAMVSGYRLLTRAPRRYHLYSPDLELIAPTAAEEAAAAQLLTSGPVH